jgi:hypothetical protein
MRNTNFTIENEQAEELIVHVTSTSPSHIENVWLETRGGLRMEFEALSAPDRQDLAELIFQHLLHA